jgi:hypothetical protein
MSQRKLRNSQGRFIPKPEDEEVQNENKIVVNVGRAVWRNFRTTGIIIFLILLTLPWTIIFFEPAKKLGLNCAELIANLTTIFKDSVCSCQINKCSQAPAF